jgi:hypothetical protein
LTEDIKTTAFETFAAERLDSFPAQEGRWCHYCSFYDLCPAKRHQLMLEKQESRAEEGEQTWQQRAFSLATQYLESYRKAKTAEAELESLRSDIIALSKDHDLSTLEGATGKVTVKIDRREKFVTKSEDAQAYADLSHFVREWQLDGYFVLDSNALMKELYQKRTLNTQQLETLKRFIVEKEESRVTVKLKQDTERDED